jgi:hypothetical protein
MNRSLLLVVLTSGIGCSNSPAEPGIDSQGVSLSYQQGAGPIIKLEGKTAQYVLYQDLSVLARIITPAKSGVAQTLFELTIDAAPIGVPLPATYDIANPNGIGVALTTLNAVGERALADSGSVTISRATTTSVEGSLSLRLSFFQTPNGPQDPIRIHGRFYLESASTPPPIPF